MHAHAHTHIHTRIHTHAYTPMQTIAVLCDRNALEVHRYGHPMKFPDTPKLQLIQALCGRGNHCLDTVIIVAKYIPSEDRINFNLHH